MKAGIQMQSFGQKEEDDPWGWWGGAIVFYIGGQKNILSFSGLPELWDEAAMFVLAIKIGELSEVEVLQEISDERNPHLRPLLAACDFEAYRI